MYARTVLLTKSRSLYPDEIVLRRQDEKDCAAILKGLSTLRAGSARLKIASSDQAYSRQKNSLRLLWQQRAEEHRHELLKKLMGNNVMDLPVADAYSGLLLARRCVNSQIC
jgi:hypothetical protein